MKCRSVFSSARICAVVFGFLFINAWGQCQIPEVVNGSFPEYYGHWWDDGAAVSIKKCIWDGEVYQDAADRAG